MSSYNPAIPTQPAPVRLKKLATFGFFSLCAFAMLNVNFFTRTFLQTEQVLSVFYLLACLLVLFGLRFPIVKSIGRIGLFWLFVMATFLAVSTRLGIGVDSKFLTSLSSDVYRIVTAQLIIVAGAVGARHLYLAGKLQLMLRVCFGLTLLAASTIILAKFIPVLAVRDMQGRMGGVFTDANAAGHAVTYSAALGFACLVGEKSSTIRLAVFGGLAMLIPCLLLTNSRSSILFMGLLVIAQFFISPLMKRKGMILAIVLLAAGIPIGIKLSLGLQGSVVDRREAINLEVRQDRLESIFRVLRGEMNDSDTGHRFVVGAVGFKYFLDNPVIGAGFAKLLLMPEVGLGCHNTFLRVLGEGGLFCGLLYASAVFFVGLAGWNSKNPSVRCLVVGFIISYACSAMVAHTVLTARIGNVLMGICLGLLTAAATEQLTKSKLRRASLVQQQRSLHAQGAAIPASV